MKITESQKNSLTEQDERQMLKDIDTINFLSKKYPQWDFSNAIIRREKNINNQTYRFLDGLFCNIHNITNDNINVSDLLKRGSGCRKCGKDRQIEAGMSKKPLEQWVSDLDKVGFETKIENFEYINKDGKNILYVKDAICKKCGKKLEKYLNVWEINSGKIKCPGCSIGKWTGEEELKNILDNMKIKYSFRHIFPDLKGREHTLTTKKGLVSKTRTLPLYCDFYLPEKNVIIEYDGEYHFYEREGRSSRLDNQIFNDIKKNEYGLKNGIKVIRISYTDKKDILSQLEKGFRSGNKIWMSDNYPKLGWNK